MQEFLQGKVSVAGNAELIRFLSFETVSKINGLFLCSITFFEHCLVTSSAEFRKTKLSGLSGVSRN